MAGRGPLLHLGQPDESKPLEGLRHREFSPRMAASSYPAGHPSIGAFVEDVNQEGSVGRSCGGITIRAELVDGGQRVAGGQLSFFSFSELSILCRGLLPGAPRTDPTDGSRSQLGNISSDTYHQHRLIGSNTVRVPQEVGLVLPGTPFHWQGFSSRSCKGTIVQR